MIPTPMLVIYACESKLYTYIQRGIIVYHRWVGSPEPQCSGNKRAYVHGFTLTLIEARISVGESRFRHEFSKFLAGGFRIKALTGRPLLREEQMQIGLAILSNDDLVRELVTLGWDTLEVHDSVGKQGLKWELKKYTNIGGVLSCGEE